MLSSSTKEGTELSLTHCNTCGLPINWNKIKRKELGINGPLNTDLSVHKCYTAHKEETPKAVDLPVTTKASDVLAQNLIQPEFSANEIVILKQFVRFLKEVTE
ncbi:MAG: hypothetical protein DLM72_12525 [Candidatus Nitrosopolaris wilkensis]|nr:MAG: hypothetical protein DLM72_12525 [Candidatus Nitrosopolaris wilkensis]